MTQRSEFRFAGLLALAAMLAAPTLYAQSTAPTTDPAQTAASQPASPAPQAEAVPAKKTWADLDIDKNGNLDKAEAGGAPSLQAVFDQADANADGALTGEEYKTYLAANGQQEKPVKPQK
jgi:EF hand